MSSIPTMVPKLTELWNAWTMVSGLFYALQPIAGGGSSHWISRIGHYTYGVVCINSIHLHLGRAYGWSPEKDALGYRMDGVSQMLCVLGNAYLTWMGGYGIALSLVGIGLNLYQIPHLTPLGRKWLCHGFQATLMIGLVWGQTEVMIWYSIGFFAFVLSKLPTPISIWLHGVFHIALTNGMRALWEGQETMAWPETRTWPVAEVLGGMLLIAEAHLLCELHGPPFKYLNRVVLNAGLGTLAVVSFGSSLYHSYQPVPFEEWRPLSRVQVYSELGTYTVNTLIDAYNRDGEMVYHHVLSIMGVGAAAYYGFPNLLAWALGVLIPTNMFLWGAKWARAAGREDLAKRLFGGFAALFAILRLGGFSMFYYHTLQRSHSVGVVSVEGYIVFNAVIGLLYILQWVWFGKIVRILRKNLKKD